ncbi:MAG: hypothetical protein FJ178_00555 [Gammaproteobacteria bacterium]|nr:hypothetical protein [Gammaproteobacteria bacterium]
MKSLSVIGQNPLDSEIVAVSGYTIFVADTRHTTVFELSQSGALPRTLETLKDRFTARHDHNPGDDPPESIVM